MLIREPYYGRLEDLPEEKRIVKVALAQFLYRPDEGVESHLYVSAHIFFHDSDGKAMQPELYSTVWDGVEPRQSKEFSAGKVHDLIVALFPLKDAKAIILYEYDTRKVEGYWGSDVSFSPKPHEIKGEEFFLRIDLIPKRVNDPLPKQSFWFKLTLGPESEFIRINEPTFGLRFN